ncbi:MAG: hypothetical protein ACKVX7_03570 [Planctomycetota bacterium]
MASTVLAQILENVANGALLPLSAPPTVAPPAPPSWSSDALMTDWVDAELEVLITQCLVSAQSAPPELREQVHRQFCSAILESLSDH